MEDRKVIGRRTMSLSIENHNFSTISVRNREITNAINNRNPNSLLRVSFARTSVSPTRQVEEKSDTSVQLLMLKRTIDQHMLTMGKGDNTLTTLRQELKQLEFDESKREFWARQNNFKIRNLEKSIEQALDNQIIELNNQEIYNHLLKRMKKTKIFLEIRSGVLSQSLENSEFVLNSEVKKKLVSQEASFQALSTYKEFKKSIQSEKIDGSNQINELQKSIEKSRLESDRRDLWKKHQETMYEAAVIEDRSTKNLKMKEGLSLHRLWYNVLTRIYEKKKAKSKKLEDAFQDIKIVTGIPEITLVVENFLTKEQTYQALMATVGKKEVECTNYKTKIDMLQTSVNNYANKDFSDGSSLSEMRENQQAKIKEMLELSQKKFLIENTYSKVKTWIKLMIKKFNKILNRPHLELPLDESLVFYIQEIRKICNIGLKHNEEVEQPIGVRVEDFRKLAVDSMMKNMSKLPHHVIEEEKYNENDLIGVEHDEEKVNSKQY